MMYLLACRGIYLKGVEFAANVLSFINLPVMPGDNSM